MPARTARLGSKRPPATDRRKSPQSSLRAFLCAPGDGLSEGRPWMGGQARSRPCQRCGVIIPSERVEVLPQTRLCVECSKAVGGEFDLEIVPENLAKAGS